MLEILVAITILLVISGISINSLLNWRSEKTLDSASDITIGVLEEVRNLTINGYGGSQHGVFLGKNDQITSFVGDVYVESDTSNIITLLPKNKIISTSTLGNLIVFKKFSGAIGTAGKIVIQDKNNASSTRTILLDSLGAVSLQK